MRRSNALSHLILGAVLTLLLDLAQPAVAAITSTTPSKQQKDADRGPINAIINGMQGAGERLKQGDTGSGTRTMQEKVVDDIQKLIDAAKPKSRDGNQQPNSGSRRERGSQDREQQSHGKSGSDASSEPAGGGQPGRKSGAGKPLPSGKKLVGRPQRPLLREVWGHLPPALRERVPSDFHETILPDYDDLVRRYFEALLDGASPPRPNPPIIVPAQGPSGQALPAQ
jgi:hypothetical protein